MTNLVDIDELDSITQEIVYEAQIEASVCGDCKHRIRYYDGTHECERRPNILDIDMIELKKCGWRKEG
jgi:hypothetical protein